MSEFFCPDAMLEKWVWRHEFVTCEESLNGIFGQANKQFLGIQLLGIGSQKEPFFASHPYSGLNTKKHNKARGDQLQSGEQLIELFKRPTASSHIIALWITKVSFSVLINLFAAAAAAPQSSEQIWM